MRAEYIVYWPGRTTVACAEHTEKLKNLARILGFSLGIEICLSDCECTNCSLAIYDNTNL